MSTTTWVVLGIIAVIVIYAIMAYNSLVAMAQRVNQAFVAIVGPVLKEHWPDWEQLDNTQLAALGISGAVAAMEAQA